MAFNFNDIIAAETKKQEEAAINSSGGGLGFKTVYPFNNGRLEFKFIGNEPSGLLYRELCFHEYWSDSKKQKVPCLHNMYGLDCPICNAVSNVQNTLDDKDIWSKYGFKKQGIMFAKLVGFSPDNYFGDQRNNPPKVGDIVLFMFPKSVIAGLRDLIIEYQEDVENIFTNNTTRVVTLKVGTQTNGFPEYTFYVKGSNDTLCIDTVGNPDQNAFNEFMAEMPNLNEVKFPSSPDENMMNIHRTVVEEINRKYFGAAVTGATPMPNPTQMASAPIPNPASATNVVPAQSVATNVQAPVNTTAQTPVQPAAPTAPVTPAAPVAETPVAPAPAESAPAQPASASVGTEDPRGPRPSCFGDNKYDDACANCPWDSECV